MFENLSDRIAGTVLFGLDVAVEFATLGEFRLVDPDLAPAPAPVLRSADSRQRWIELDDVDFTLLPGPSTALARATAPAGAAVVAPSAPARVNCERRRRTPEPAKPPTRLRAGAMEPPQQLCLLVD